MGHSKRTFSTVNQVVRRKDPNKKLIKFIKKLI